MFKPQRFQSIFAPKVTRKPAEVTPTHTHENVPECLVVEDTDDIEDLAKPKKVKYLPGERLLKKLNKQKRKDAARKEQQAQVIKKRPQKIHVEYSDEEDEDEYKRYQHTITHILTGLGLY